MNRGTPSHDQGGPFFSVGATLRRLRVGQCPLAKGSMGRAVSDDKFGPLINVKPTTAVGSSVWSLQCNLPSNDDGSKGNEPIQESLEYAKCPVDSIICSSSPWHCLSAQIMTVRGHSFVSHIIIAVPGGLHECSIDTYQL